MDATVLKYSEFIVRTYSKKYEKVLTVEMFVVFIIIIKIVFKVL